MWWTPPRSQAPAGNQIWCGPSVRDDRSSPCLLAALRSVIRARHNLTFQDKLASCSGRAFCDPCDVQLTTVKGSYDTNKKKWGPSPCACLGPGFCSFYEPFIQISLLPKENKMKLKLTPLSGCCTTWWNLLFSHHNSVRAEKGLEGTDWDFHWLCRWLNATAHKKHSLSAL